MRTSLRRRGKKRSVQRTLQAGGIKNGPHSGPYSAPMPATLLMCALLLAVPAAAAALLRWARCPGWSVVGGVAAGLLLGPTIMGRVLPDRFEATFAGGVEERVAMQELVSRQTVERLAAESAGYDANRIMQMGLEHTRQRDVARRRLTDARWADQGALRLLTFALVAFMLLGSAAFGERRGPGEQGGVAGAMSIGAWSAALPGGVAFCALRWVWDCTAAQSALGAAAVAIGPWALTAIDRAAANYAEVGGARMVQTAGRMATLIAIALAVLAIRHQAGGLSALWAVPLLAILVSWLLPPAPEPEPGASVRFIRFVLRFLLVPAVAACVAVKVDLYLDFAVWPIALFLLLSGDGRWLGAFTGAMILGGREALRTMRLVLGSMAAGPTQLAVTAVAIHMWSIPAVYATALLLGAVLIEVTTPARRSMARRLVETEVEIEQLREE